MPQLRHHRLDNLQAPSHGLMVLAHGRARCFQRVRMLTQLGNGCVTTLQSVACGLQPGVLLGDQMAKCQQLIELAIDAAQPHQIQLGRARALRMRPDVLEQFLHMRRRVALHPLERLDRRIQHVPTGSAFGNRHRTRVQRKHAGVERIRVGNLNAVCVVATLLGTQERLDRCARRGLIDGPLHVERIADAGKRAGPVRQQARVIADRTSMAGACTHGGNEVGAPEQVGMRAGDGIAALQRCRDLVGMAHRDQHPGRDAGLEQGADPDRGQQRHARVLDGPQTGIGEITPDQCADVEPRLA